MDILGIDVGGTGIKAALVDVEAGELVTKRVRIKTPQPASPESIIATIRELVQSFSYGGLLGVGFPAVIRDGTVLSAANVAEEWIGYPGARGISEATGCTVTLLNDADAAGLAEMRFGAGRGEDGLVIVLTLGTGIGSALFMDGRLVPNSELGHVYLAGHREDAEDYASDRIRVSEGLGWKAWARRLDETLRHLEGLFSPNLYILGGGVSKRHDKFIPRLTLRTRVVPAQLRNEAGVIGAALAVMATASSPHSR